MRRRLGAFVTLAVGLAIVLAGADWTRAQSGQGSVQQIEPEKPSAVKAQNDKAIASNALIAQINPALQNKQWQQAAELLKQLIAISPEMWTYRQGLGIALMNLGQYDDAVKSFQGGIKLAQVDLQSKPPDSDAAKAEAGLGSMLTNEGNAYIKLNKNDLAIAAYTKAAEIDPNPGVAYFNLCAVQYNMGLMAGASAACDKAIAADPKKADAYFIKGSAMFGDGKLDANNKYGVPPGTVEVLKKYLELAPDGTHAADVKAMLDSLVVKQ
jgi:tetratricopeptide (TPR) repeat protein